MGQTSPDLVELVRGIVVPLVEDKDAVEVTSTVADDSLELIEIKVVASSSPFACSPAPLRLTTPMSM